MKYLLLLLIPLTFLACEHTPTQPQIDENTEVTQEQIDSILTKYAFDYEEARVIDSTELVLIPISTHESGRTKSYSSYGSSYYESPPRYWNILFYNRNTAELHLLTESKLRISNYEVVRKRGGEKLNNSILYKITAHDYHKNGILNSEDPEQLYISHLDGRELTMLSPKEEDLYSYKIIPNTDQLIIRTRRDTHRDMRFDHKDEAIWYLIDLAKDSVPVEIINEVERKKIGNLYFEQWLRK